MAAKVFIKLIIMIGVKKMRRPLILNAQGKPVLLNKNEQRLANNLTNTIRNALGYEVDITTLTTIIKKVSEQKFFELPPADFIPVRVGEGAWSSQLTTYRSFNISDDFETGILGGKVDNSRLASADAGVDTLTVKVRNWAKEIGWTIMDLAEAQRAGNWDLVTAKEKSRKRNWDLGIQKIAFLGHGSDSEVLGLLTQSGITTNTTTITKAINTMTGPELKTFVTLVLDDYRVNCNRSAWPTHFVIPESDYLGLAGPSNADFHIKSVLEILENTFKIMTKNEGFKILANAYGDSAHNTLGVQKYALYNSDEESIRMDIPVDYTNTLANSVDNFSFKNVGYGQFTGVKAYRPLELLYYQF